MSSNRSFDVVIVGAGIAGCHAAASMAARNLSVALIDQKPLAQAGPGWINAVPSWMFDHARLATPRGDELFHMNNRFIIRAPDRSTRLVLNQLNVPDVHMGLLGKRLKHSFLCSSGAYEICASVLGGTYSPDGRLTHVHATLPSRRSISLAAKLFVDASGLSAILRKSHPRADAWWPDVKTSDLCTAAQRTLAIGDREGAITFLERNRIEPGDVLSDVGTAGGFSLFRAQVSHDLSHLSLLCGVGCDFRYPSAHRIIDTFVAQNSRLARTLVDGRGAIPLNAPYAQLVAPGLALLGDAACQVYPAHGSGIGFGLIAARLLADAVSDAQVHDRDIGARESLIPYQQQFHGRYYQRLYFSEQFRKFSQSLSEQETTQLVASGIISEAMAKQTLRQENPTLTSNALTMLIARLAKAPRLARKLVPVFGSALAGRVHAARMGAKVNVA